MKRTNFIKNLLTAFLAAFLLIGVLSVGTLAAFEGEDMQNEVCVEGEANDSLNGTASGEVVPDVKSDKDSVADIKTDGIKVNFFERLYSAVADYISEILCVLAFLGSFLIAVLYKKGLLPLIKGALGAINSAVGRIKDATERCEITESEKSAKITESLERAYSLIEGQTRMLDEVEKRLDALAYDKSERDKMKLILESEVELLYDIFMSSGLPEYQKDTVAKRLKAIGAIITEGVKEA